MAKATTRSNAEMAKFEEIFDKKLSDFGKTLAIQEGLNELKDLFKSLTETLKDQKEEIKLVKQTVQSQDIRISQLEDKVAVLEASVEALKNQSDSHEQYSRRACLRINGIEKARQESSEQCVQKVIEACKDQLDVDLKAEDIDRAHRIGRERKTMIVKFYSFSKRCQVYKSRKNGGENLKVYLDITKPRLKLLDEAREMITVDGNVDFVFADINCNTVAKLKNDGGFKFFDNVTKFEEILAQ